MNLSRPNEKELLGLTGVAPLWPAGDGAACLRGRVCFYASRITVQSVWLPRWRPCERRGLWGGSASSRATERKQGSQPVMPDPGEPDRE